MRNFNIDQQFAEIQKAATEAANEIFPVEGKNRSVILKKVWVEDNTDSKDFAAQAKTKSRDGTYGVPVYASLELVDKIEKKVIDRNEKLRLFLLPKVTDRFSYIIKGNEYQVHNQLRLKPGVYTLRKQNGELKTQVNLSKGKNFDLVFNEKKNIFYISKVGGGQANIPLYPVLIHLGMSHQAISKGWGEKLAAANKSNDPKVIEKLRSAFGIKKGTLKEYLNGTKIDAETTKSALGKSFTKVDGGLLLSSAADLLKTHLGKKEPTDRDSLEYKELHSVEDFIKERIQKNKQSLAFKIKRNLNSPKKVKLTQIVNPAGFSSTIESFFTQDDKSSTPEQTNPLEMITGQYKTTIMGSGGITQEHAITNNMREVHPSHFGFMDPIHTPESSKIGANLHLPLGVVKDGNQIKTVLLDKKGKAVTLTPKQAFDKKVIFPGQKGNKVKALYKGKQIVIDRSEGDYTSPDSKAPFTWSTNLVPFLPSNQGNRAMMASKMLEQAISLKHREAPLVQVGATKDSSVEGQIGRTLAATATIDGIISKVTKDEIIIKGGSGSKKVNLYNNFTLNRKSFLDHKSVVKVGDKVKKGQLLADSNFTKDGTLALGTNLKTAYLPYGGLNFEDGIVISETAAKKLTSEHIHKKHIDIDDNTVMRLPAYKAMYPNGFNASNINKLDNTGVIKKGETIKHGEALIVALRRSTVNTDVALIRKQLSDRPKDVSLVWTSEDDGIIMNVKRTAKRVTVFIKTEEAAKIGDKLAGRMGNKGIITKIISDAEAPKTKDGEAADILLNPHGVISRINIGQIYESAAGKVAKKKGKPHLVSNFSGENYRETTNKILKDAKISDKEEMFDGKTGKSLGKVHVGNPYILKLFKQGSANFSARQGGPGQKYDLNHQPVKAGGEEGSKSLDLLSMYSMLSHGARANLREMNVIKSNQNDEYWKAVKSGQQIPPPNSPFVYEKFMEYLKASGIDVKKKGSELTLAPLTDKQVESISKMEIKDPRFYVAKDQKPIKGGFLDQVKLGGFNGEGWGHIELKEAVVNPVFETAVKKVSGLGKKFDDLMEGALFLEKDGSFNKDGKGLTGGAAVEQVLKTVNVEGDLKKLMAKALKSKGSQLDGLNKHIRYLKSLKDLKMNPVDAYMRKKVPVIPPKYRPIYPMPDGNMMNADANVLYNNVAIIDKMMKLDVVDLLPEEEKASARKELYQGVKAVSGLTDLNIKGRVRDGFISEIKGGHGGQPKHGYFISKVLSKKQDFVGRATIIPEPDLGIDEVALPEKMAWKLMEPFVIRELKGHGKTPIQAMEEIKNKTALARKALEIVMKERKVLLNRAPSLHKFSIMAFRPKITEGKALKIPPLVVDGFNADYDGDQQVGVIVTFLKNEVTENLKLGTSNPERISNFLEDRKMTARFKANVPTIDNNGDVYVFNLEDFPHGELLGSKEGEKGPIEFYKALEGTKVISYDQKTGNSVWADVFGWSKHYQREIEIVTLTSGRQIITDDDPRAVYGAATGSLELSRFTPSEAVNQGVWVPRLNLKNTTIDGEGKKAIPFKGSKLSLGHGLGYVFGSIAANGWAEHRYGNLSGNVFLSTTTKPVYDKFLEISKDKFKYEGIDLTYQRNKGDGGFGEAHKAGFMEKSAARIIENSVGSGAGNKHLPPYFLNAPRKFRLGLFAGLMDNDGSIAIVQAKAKNKPQLQANYSSISIRLIQEVQLLASDLGIRSRITPSKTPAGAPFWMLSFSNIDIKKWGGEYMVHPEKLKALHNGVVDENSPVVARNDMIPISKNLATVLRKTIGAPRSASNEQKSFYAILHKALKTGGLSRKTCLRIPAFIDLNSLSGIEGFNTWWEHIVNRLDVTWDRVKDYQKTGIKEDGYDLTVPGYETFMNIDGVILSNTMSIHTPISDEANDEAERMLPSRNLYKPGSGKLMINPSQEAQVGIFYLSKTPAGRVKINKILPKKYAVTGKLDKNTTKDLLMKISKEMDNGEFANVVAKLKAAGETKAYDMGFTLGMDDLADFSKDRDKITSVVSKMVKNAKTDKELSDINKKAQNLIDGMISKRLKDKDNPLYDMVESGARGSMGQLRQILATPLLVTDSNQKVVKSVIKKSYAEGLDIGDYWTSMYGARRGMMDRALQTSLPGAFSKDIMASTIDNVITKSDCGVQAGRKFAISDRDLIGRYLAKDQSGISRNTLIDASIVNNLKSKNLKAVEARSPLKCLVPKGTCAYCYGIDEHGSLPSIGDNVGAKAGQTISEPLIQLIMNSFHTGGTAGTGSDVGGYKRIEQLLHLPKVVAGSATLSSTSGKVARIQKGIAGGFDVWVGKKREHISQGRKLKVKLGDMVKKGDTLSDGVIKPQDLVKLKGMESAQNYVADELHNAYSSQGVRLDKKVFETVVRSAGNTTQVLNNPNDSDFVPGDIVPYTVAQHYNKNLDTTVKTDDALGMTLATRYGPFVKGHKIIEKDVKMLKVLGHKEVKVSKEAILHAPTLRGVTTIPLLRKDWMAALGYRNLAKALTEGAGQGWKTDLEGHHPVPAFAFGKTFGQGKDGKY